MRGRVTIQRVVAAGGFTLPVAIALFGLLWIYKAENWYEVISWFIHLITGILIIELNISYSLIRRRTSFHVALYAFFASISFFLHPFQAAWFTIPLFYFAIHQLLRIAESTEKVSYLYQSFFFLAITVLFEPHFLFLIPLFGIGTLIFNSCSGKGFFASLLGFATPYWLLLAYSIVRDDYSLLTASYHSIKALQPFQYATLPALPQLYLMATILLLTFVCTFYYLNFSYLDKSRTRTYFYFLFLCQLTLYSIIIIFPEQMNLFFALSLPISALIGGHFFTLTNNRFSNFFFIVIFVTLISATIYYLWMH